jgi:uncharacterized damage-inducible protein DinB
VPHPRPDIPQVADELTMLTAFLDWMRATLRMKAGDLDAEQLQRRLEPSTMTLGGMVTHMAWVESWWFTEIFHGRPPAEPWASFDWKADGDAEWAVAASMEPGEIWALWDTEVERARGILVEAGDLDAIAVGHRKRKPGQPLSMRWIVVHMIEEYARHLGHADLIRESIDGSVGQ